MKKKFRSTFSLSFRSHHEDEENKSLRRGRRRGRGETIREERVSELFGGDERRIKGLEIAHDTDDFLLFKGTGNDLNGDGKTITIDFIHPRKLFQSIVGTRGKEMRRKRRVLFCREGDGNCSCGQIEIVEHQTV